MCRGIDVAVFNVYPKSYAAFLRSQELARVSV